MAKKKDIRQVVKGEATAKAELSAKLIRERKHSVKEVIPPDVTRAKAGAWLDLISPITEWAGLKGDALKHHRQQLRIQQEITLEELAESIRRKMAGNSVNYPLPPKVLVPALEGASLEPPTSPLIDWWANLLVSGATKQPIRPFFVDLMGKIDTEEAAYLNRIWRVYAPARADKEAINPRSVVGYVSGYLHGALDTAIKKSKSEEEFHLYLKAVLGAFVERADKMGLGIQISFPTKKDNSSRGVLSSDFMKEGAPWMSAVR